MHRTMISRSQGDKLELDLPPCNLFNHTRGIPRQQSLCETPLFSPKKQVVCTGFAFHPDSDGFPIVMLQGFQLTGSDDIFTGDGAAKMEDNTPNGLSAVLQMDSTC